MLFVVGIVILHVTGALRFVERPLAKVFHKTSGTIYTISVWQNDTFDAQTMTGDELQAAFVALQKKYRDAIIKKSEYITLKQEHENVINQLSFFSDKEWDYKTTRITGKNVDPFQSSVSLFIDEAHKYIPLGAPAVTDTGIFVGTVSNVTGDIVSVRLLDDGKTKIGGALLNDERTVGVIEGGIGRSIRMNFIPQNENVSAGDIVVSSGLSEHIPYGLPIGTVEAVEKEPYQPFQSAVISPLVNSNALDILSIIIVDANDLPAS